eukprot:scaffold133374_cov79-Phaeocystis_antarctica.AAC.1
MLGQGPAHDLGVRMGAGPSRRRAATARRRARQARNLDAHLGAHHDGAELLLEGAAAQRPPVEREQAVVHGEAAAPLGLRAGCDRHHPVLAVEREPQPERRAHQLDHLRHRPARLGRRWRRRRWRCHLGAEASLERADGGNLGSCGHPAGRHVAGRRREAGEGGALPQTGRHLERRRRGRLERRRTAGAPPLLHPAPPGRLLREGCRLRWRLLLHHRCGRALTTCKRGFS